MTIWDIMTYAAWGISGLLLLWMLADMFRVDREYAEDLLMSSREGVDELIEHGGLKAPPAERG
jgi:hypothetical protein